MNKTFWMGYVAVFVVLWAIGFLVHEIWLQDAYAELAGVVFRSEAEINSRMWMMLASSLVYIFLFCYIFTKGYEGKGIAEGARYGLLIGLFMSVPMTFDQYVVYPLPQSLAITWFVTGLVNFVLAGAVFAAIYRPTTATTAAPAAV